MKQEIRERIEKIGKGEVPEGYRKTMVGIVVKEWDLIEFKTVFEEVSELTSDIQKYPLSSLTIQTGVEAKTERYERSFLITKEGDNYKIVSKDQFVFNPMNIRFGAIGRYKGETKVCVSGYYNVFRCINGNNSAYMEYLLKDDRMIQLYNKYSLGSLIEKQRLHYSHFIKFKIPLPKIKEQQKITDILSTWDKAIALKEKLVEEKKKFKRGLRKGLLSGGVRFKEFNGAWQEFKLNEVVKKIKGTLVQASSNGNMPVIDMDYIDCRIPKNYSDSGTIASKEDVLILWDGSGAGRTFTGFEGVIGSTIAVLKCNSVNNTFLQQHMDMNLKRIQLIREGSGVPHVPKDLLNYYKISLPESSEQKKIAEVLSLIDKEIIHIESEIKNLYLQKKGLMQLLLTGIVRVEVD